MTRVTHTKWQSFRLVFIDADSDAESTKCTRMCVRAETSTE